MSSSIMTTIQQYDTAVKSCRDIFLKKTIDYGTSWRVLRTISVVDQIYIKAKRIRTIQEKGEQKTVNFNIKVDDLKFFDNNLNYVAEPGNFKVYIGSNSRDVKEKEFELL